MPNLLGSVQDEANYHSTSCSHTLKLHLFSDQVRPSVHLGSFCFFLVILNRCNPTNYTFRNISFKAEFSYAKFVKICAR